MKATVIVRDFAVICKYLERIILMKIFFLRKQRVAFFMNKLFKEDIFDVFEVRSSSIIHLINLEINGELVETPGSYIPWPELKHYIFHFIKGKIKPKQIKIVFSMPKRKLGEIAPNLAAAFLNMEYSNDEIRFVTATSQQEFSLNKAQDMVWDEFVRDFFAGNEIVVEKE